MDDPARTTAEPSRDALARLLVDVSAARLAAVAQDVFQFLALPAQFPWDDSAAVVTHIDSLPPQSAKVPPLLAYAARLAHEVEDLRALEINRWVDSAGRAAGLPETTLRQLYVDSRPASPVGRYTVAETDISDKINRIEDPALTSQSVTTDLPRALLERSDPVRIWGGIPIRNPDFTGRESLLLNLERSLETRSKASVLPHALHGFGGVGKTQLAVEYAYRFTHRYDLVWWIPAEQQSLVLQSLVDLGRQLGIPVTEELTQASSLVIDALSSTRLRWLLVYDNANEPDDLAHLIPSSGGHVILTSRNQTWSNVWDAIEVNIFERPESVELIQKRGSSITFDDADRLAEKLGDLPLALDQAASWQAATGMAVSEYLSLFDRHVQELLSEGKPASYPTTIAALVKLAFQRLRRDAPAVAQLLEMFAIFGAEPVSLDLLRRGRNANITAPLGPALRDPIRLGRIARDLRKYGLAKVDPDNRIQVHRLFQLVLGDELSPEQAGLSRLNVHRLLGSANPGEPDRERNFVTHAEIGPHVQAAGLISADSEDGRRVVLDQIRYLWVIGDNEGSRRLGEAAVRAWSQPSDQADIGPDGELTLLATRHLANALLSLGINERARGLAESALERLRSNPAFGPDHEHTLSTAATVAYAVRVAGEFQESLAIDTDIAQRSSLVFGDDDPQTLTNRSNLAVNLRMLSDFNGAFEMDQAIVTSWQETVPAQDGRLLFAQANLARDLYGLGQYSAALALQRDILPTYRQIMPNPKHPYVLWAARTLAISLRKTGRYAEALAEARENYRDCAARYGQDHQHSLAATMTFANTLRVTGELGEARGLAVDAVARYQRVFGEKHPLSLTAAINLAIIFRSLGAVREARELDEETHSVMASTLGAEHGYTLCAASNLANDFALAGETSKAQRLSAETLAASRRSRGEAHPYTLLCAVNAGFDLLTVGETADGRVALNSAVEALGELLGPDHPETLDALRGKRAECDIEPPPT